ncbi:serine/threonine protein kinase [Chitinophaga rhizophila]|uniref:Protein kinase n=1 Tax=Chitinophaga rhizophila TaxID=2866212 RepID=A0ABS7GFY9_9BACT|nr:protein kinase [Chitinophaga rhizophila]MBW8686331.1 protein kinase [Chitinophaga rhizophila]
MIALNPYEDIIAYETELLAYKLDVKTRGVWLECGKLIRKRGIAIVISVVKLHMKPLLDRILPVLSAQRVPFVMVKDSLIHHYTNMGGYGGRMVGHIFTFYTDNNDDLILLLKHIVSLTVDLKGPVVRDALQLSQSVFVFKYELIRDKNGQRHKQLSRPAEMPMLEELRIKQPLKYIPQKAFVRKLYFNVRTIKSSPKGNIYSVRSLMHLGRKLIIKQGNLNMVDDYDGRTIRDRLLWQKRVLSDLHGKLSLPKPIDFFEISGDSYLVLSFINAECLDYRIKNVYKKGGWNTLSSDAKQIILNYFVKVLKQIALLHDNGYVHRDIKHDNLMITVADEPVLLDFELSWSLRDKYPNPPFLVKSPGYQAPEQLQLREPSVKEDVYSCGALLFYLLSGEHPKCINEQRDIGNLFNIGVAPEFTKLIKECMSADPNDRPEIKQILHRINIHQL